MNLRELISKHEDRVPYAYQDPLGYWTIGVGHLVDKKKGGRLSEKVIDIILDDDIKTHSDELFAKVPWAGQLDEVRRAVLIDMAFNLGVAGLLKFVKFLDALKRREYGIAAFEMMDSTWAHQVGDRARELKDMILSGKWP